MTSELMYWAFPRATHYEPWRYWSVHRAARKVAIKVSRCGKGNRPSHSNAGLISGLL
jgi:hypothetical protein